MLIVKSSAETRDTPPAGTHAARCWLVADLGTQTREFEGKPRTRREVALGWCYQDPEREGVTHEVVRVFTASLGAKATLRTFLEGWRGRSFSTEQAESFDLRAVAGKACLLVVTHRARGDRTFADVSSAAPLPKGMAAPPELVPVLFDLDSPETWGALERLPKFLREAVMASPEWAERREVDPFAPQSTEEVL